MARKTTKVRQRASGPVMFASPAAGKLFTPKETIDLNELSMKDGGISSARQQNRVHAGGIEKYTKFRPMVSVAGVFPRPQRESHRHSRGHALKNLESTPNLASAFRDELADVQNHIGNGMKKSFEGVHASLFTSLEESDVKDKELFERVDEAAILLNAPLVEEQIETQFKRDGIMYTEIVQISDRMNQFKKLVELENGKLQRYWKEWDEVQNEYLELGVEVFGPEAFEEDTIRGSDEGYRKEMKLIEVEHIPKVNQLSDRAEVLSRDILEKLKKVEQDMDATVKREQTVFLQQLLTT